MAKTPMTLIGDFSNPLGIGATCVVVALILGCLGQLVALFAPKRTTQKKGTKKTTPKAAGAPASAKTSAKKNSAAAKKTTTSASKSKKTPTAAAAASLVSPSRASTRSRTPAKKYVA